MLTSLTPLVASALIAVGPVTGGAFNDDWVAGDAQWFIHVDVNSFVSSQLGQFIIGHADDLDIDLSDIENVKEEIGIDPLTDFTGVTVYGADDPDDDVVFIVEMNSKIDVLVEMLKMKEKSYQAVEAGPYTLHSWRDGCETMFGHVAPGAGEEDRIVAIAHNKATLVHALRVMDDKAPSIADEEKSALLGKPVKGSFVYAAALNLTHLLGGEDDPASQIIRRARRISLDVGEKGEIAYATARLTARDSEEARNIMDVLNGITALGRMIADTEEGAELPIEEVLDALDIARDGDTLSVSLHGNAATLLKSVHEIHEELD